MSVFFTWVARDQRQHHDGGQIRQHAQQLAGHLHARGLQVKLQHGHAAKQISPQQHPRGAPRGKGGERQRNPAAPGDHALDPQRRVNRGDISPRQPAQRAAGHHRRQADAPHRVAQRVRRLGRLAHRAQHQTGARAVQKPHQCARQQHRAIHQRVLAKQRRPQERHIAQQRNGVFGQLRQFGLHVVDADKGRKADAKQTQRQAGGVLVGAQPNHQQAKNAGQQRPGGHARRKTQPRVAGVYHRGKASNGGAEHQALRAQIDHTGLFVD